MVRAINVRDGQAVQAGEVLLTLDATTRDAEVQRLDGDRLAARLDLARASSMLLAIQEIANRPLSSSGWPMLAPDNRRPPGTGSPGSTRSTAPSWTPWKPRSASAMPRSWPPKGRSTASTRN